MRKVFTTGQVATMCKVSGGTVKKWFDKGFLKGFRIPNTLHRRVLRTHLYAFMKQHGFPLGELANQSRGTILFIGEPHEDVALLRDVMKGEGLTVEETHSGFGAGFVIKTLRPDCAITDCSGDSMCALWVAHRIKLRPDCKNILLIGLAESRATVPSISYMIFHKLFERPLHIERIVHHIIARIEKNPLR